MKKDYDTAKSPKLQEVEERFKYFNDIFVSTQDAFKTYLKTFNKRLINVCWRWKY